MNINIKFTDTEHDEDLRAYAEEKVLSFGKLLAEEDEAGAVCSIEFRHDTHHQHGDVCYAEVTLTSGGKVYRASKTEPAFRKAIDKVKDDILQALRVEKTKREHTFLKGSAKVKQMMRGE